jgi:DNA primase
LSSSEKIAILKQFLGSYSSTGQEYLFECPKCNHPKRKLSVNIDKGVFKCWICDYKGNSITRLVRSYADFNLKAKWREITGQVEIDKFDEIIATLFPDTEEDIHEVVKLPNEFLSLANKGRSLLSTKARNYLTRRGITEADILFWKIGYCPSGEYTGRIVIPSFNEDGDCNYFIGRTYQSDWRKYMNPPTAKSKIIFNELYVDWDEDLILTEGVFDAIIAGKNSVPILGSSLREHSRLFKSIIRNDTPVYVALDHDAEEKAASLIENLIKYGAEVYKIEVFPYNDVGEMPKKEFLNRKKAARLVSIDDAYLQRFISSFNF